MPLRLSRPDKWPELLSTSEVGELLRIAPNTIAGWCEKGRLECVRIGREWRIPADAVWPYVPPSIRARWPDGPWKDVTK